MCGRRIVAEEPDLQKLLDEQRQRTAALLKQIGQPGRCKGCGAGITWVLHNSGHNTPYDIDGLNHFASCPEAAQFRRKP
jgi:hypothetical protein